MGHRFHWSIALAACCVVFAAGGCKKSQWIEGKWLLVTPEGKPGVCHEFVRKGSKLLIHTGTDCSGPTDGLLSGKWQLKADNKLAILQGTEEEAKLVLITEKDEQHFVASGGISGRLFKVGEKGSAGLVSELEQKGEIKLRVLPPDQGCKQLSMSLADIKALPTESEPRMIRRKDQGLEYHVDRATNDPKIEKIVYAINLDVIDWIAFHLTPVAFQPPGPVGWVESGLGQSDDTASTGTGEKSQLIVMWRAYCAKLRGANNRDVDVTLFATPGQQRGTIYVSENIVSGIWEELKKTIRDAPPPEEDEGEGAAPAKAAPAKAAPAPPPAPAKAAPAPPPPPPPRPAPAPPPPPAKKAAPKPPPPPPAGGADDDEI
jgi:hypothetical protein